VHTGGYLVSIQNGPFLQSLRQPAWGDKIRGIPWATYHRYVSAQSLDFLDVAEKCLISDLETASALLLISGWALFNWTEWKDSILMSIFRHLLTRKSVSHFRFLGQGSFSGLNCANSKLISCFTDVLACEWVRQKGNLLIKPVCIYNVYPYLIPIIDMPAHKVNPVFADYPPPVQVAGSDPGLFLRNLSGMPNTGWFLNGPSAMIS